MKIIKHTSSFGYGEKEQLDQREKRPGCKIVADVYRNKMRIKAETKVIDPPKRKVAEGPKVLQSNPPIREAGKRPIPSKVA